MQRSLILTRDGIYSIDIINYNANNHKNIQYVLPQFDTRKNMELKVSIDSKIAISEVDQKRIVIKDMGSGQINIGFTDAAAITETTDIALTDEELQYLKQRVDFIDRNGMFSEFTMPTYVKILDEPLKEEQPGE